MDLFWEALTKVGMFLRFVPVMGVTLPLALGGCDGSAVAPSAAIMIEADHSHYHVHAVDASHEHSHSGDAEFGAHTHLHKHADGETL